MKKHTLQVKFEFDGKVEVLAESREEGEQLCEENLSMVVSNAIQCHNDDVIVDCEFPLHGEQVIIPKNQEG
jgi:hypothetical protein